MIVPGKVLEKTVKNKKINLHCLTDVHVGSKVFDRLLFLKAIDKIKKDPNALWFGNGDMLEFIPPNITYQKATSYLTTMNSTHNS